MGTGTQQRLGAGGRSVRAREGSRRALGSCMGRQRFVHGKAAAGCSAGHGWAAAGCSAGHRSSSRELGRRERSSRIDGSGAAATPATSERAAREPGGSLRPAPRLRERPPTLPEGQQRVLVRTPTCRTHEHEKRSSVAQKKGRGTRAMHYCSRMRALARRQIAVRARASSASAIAKIGKRCARCGFGGSKLLGSRLVPHPLQELMRCN